MCQEQWLFFQFHMTISSLVEEIVIGMRYLSSCYLYTVSLFDLATGITFGYILIFDFERKHMPKKLN